RFRIRPRAARGRRAIGGDAAEAAHRAAPPRGPLGGGGEADRHLCSLPPRRRRGSAASGDRLAHGQTGGAGRRARSPGGARLSGLTVQVDLLAMMILGEFDRLRSLGLQPAAGATPAVAQTFGAEPLRSSMREALFRSLDPERTRTLLAWLRAPFSQRIVTLEC